MRLRWLPALAVLGAMHAAGQPPPAQRPGEIARTPSRPAADPATEGTAIVRGRVTSADGRPIRLARVGMIEGTTRRAIAQTTDVDGRYEFTEVPAGTYSVTAGKSGYASMQFGQRRPTDQSKRLRIADTETVERIDFALPAASALTGRVVDENGDPVEGAGVSIYTITIVNGRRRLVLGTGRRSDDGGRFRLFNVNPGEYVLGAAAAATGAHRLPGYASTYFPGTASLAEAQVIAVKTGEDVLGLDLRLAPGRVATISGTAVDAAGQPLEGSVMLDASRRSGSLAAPPLRTFLQGDGRFEFGNVAPGDYVLQASGRGQNGIEFATRFLVVGDSDIPDLVFRTATGSSVTGRIVLEGSRSRALPRDFQFNFVTANEDLSPDPGTYRARINEDWTFEYDGLFGPLLIRPAGRSEWLLRSVRVNGTDITDTAPSFGRAADSLSDVEVVLTNRSAQVVGAATDARGLPVSTYTVVVFPIERERWTRHSRFVKAAASEPDGTFSVRGLPAGEYFVAALDRVQMTDGSGEWQDPAFLESIAPHATRASLTEGDVSSAAPRLVIR